jgi:hypothetical protein
MDSWGDKARRKRGTGCFFRKKEWKKIAEDFARKKVEYP